MVFWLHKMHGRTFGTMKYISISDSMGSGSADSRHTGSIVHFNKMTTTGIQVFLGTSVILGFISKDDEFCTWIKNHSIYENGGK